MGKTKEKKSGKKVFSFREMSLEIKIRLSFFCIIIPFFALVLFWLARYTDYNAQHERAMDNAMLASEISIDFKRDYDDKMCQIICGIISFDKADPYADIDKAMKLTGRLRSSTKVEKNRERIGNIYRSLEELRQYTEEIEVNKQSDGHYEKNIRIWRNDIKAATDDIRQQTLEYIYYESKAFSQQTENPGNAGVQAMELGILIVTGILISVIIFFIVIPKSILKPVRELVHVTEQVESGNLNIRATAEGSGEIKAFGDSINRMIENQRHLQETISEQKTKIRKMELELLQSQVNPHFLYNTLDTILWLAESERQEEVAGVARSLSEFFRISLNKGKELVTLEEEFRHVTSYLQIQQVRYGDILEYEIQIEEDILHCCLPKMTLQPLVENALYHGIKNKRGKGKITLRGQREGQFVVLSVMDNGKGMTVEQMEQVLKELKGDSVATREYFGLYNVHERIRLQFGMVYGLHLESNYMEGTTVEVELPYQENVIE